ncbi:hypothetical protein BSAF29S_05352 [Bacillus safensis subsp. safensis]
MLITDHINMMGTNPLIGPNDSQGVCFPDMSAPYDKELLALAEETAQHLGIYCTARGLCRDDRAFI